ncbi:3-carboxy-cis,cis-muconate cycloisomerase [Bosea sp. LjRoot9]|uniref:3-carboxy-cis,cis-muconate cycloisomerase n=1 Tax=Bosea sp. LjRoot9 TaxID=3342341 RepID=UPI003ED1358E
MTFASATPFASRHLADLFSTPAMRAVFSELRTLQAMLDVEVALARVQARAGLIPVEAAEAIANAADAAALDLDELAAGTLRAGLPIVNLVEQFIRLTGPAYGEFVHWGATSQDIMDTALILQIRDALALVEQDLDQLAQALAELARRERDTAMVGRTKLQHALPITFGFKAAVWLSSLMRHRQRLGELKPRLLQVQFAGAVGTHAALGADGPNICQALAEELGLARPLIAWHAVRDTLAEAMTFLGLLSTSLSKIAGDIALMAQTEVGEALEPGGPGQGASSTMPHKRNPITCERILSSGLALRRLVGSFLDASIHDHERATGPWQAEWLLLPEAFLLISGSLKACLTLCSGLKLQPDAMRTNLDRTRGLIAAEQVMMTLAPHMGRHHAHDVVGNACRSAASSHTSLAEALARDPAVTGLLTPEQIAFAADPGRYTGQAGEEVDRVLLAWSHAPHS